MSELRRTPLYDLNVELGGRMVDFAGWEMPVQFKGIVEEHKATRSAAGLFDVSHMGEAVVSGPQAREFLDFVLTNHIAKMSPNQALYSLMCYEHGGVVDDLLVYKKSETEYLLCLNASNTSKDIAWLNSKSDGFDVAVEDVSDELALLALQGPKSVEILGSLAEPDTIEKLEYYWFTECNIANVSCLVSRTGYTGERGFEIFASPSEAERIARAILEEGGPLGLIPAGLGARDSLRLEAGYSLYGHEIDEHISPVQANLMWTVKLAKPTEFIGKAALVEEKFSGPLKRIVFFKTGNRRIVRAGTPTLVDGVVVGHVVSGTFSPQLNEAIGSILLDSAHLKSELSVDMRGKSMRLYQTKPPFIKLNP